MALALTTATSCSDPFDTCQAARTCAPLPEGGASGRGGMPGVAGTVPGGGAGMDAGRAGSDAGGQAGRSDLGSAGRAPGGAGGRAGAPGSGGVSGTPVVASGGAGGEPELGDTTAPEIVSTSPADGATGVRADADIVVTFSEPMDELETEKAFESDDLTPSQIDFSWSNLGTVMTVHPSAGLEYEDAAANAPRTYHFSLTEFGRDRAGNHLTSRRDFSFTTLSRYTQTLGPVDVRQLFQSGTSVQECTTDSMDPKIGDLQDNEGVGIVISFDLSDAPGPVMAGDWVGATLSLATVVPVTQLGQLLAYHVSSAPDAAVWDETVLSELGPFANNGSATTASIDVLAALADDFMHRDQRGSLTEYLVRYEDASNFDDTPQYMEPSCSTMELSVTYFAP